MSTMTAPGAADPALSVRGVSLRFGGITVLDDVSFDAPRGGILGLVGPNGAGKTSLFNCISGHYQPASGSILVDGTETLATPAWRMARLGLARTFQHPALRLDATVLENVMLGAHSWLPGGPVSWALRLPTTRRHEREARARALELLERTGLGWAADVRADELSHGLHKGVELCRALLSRPRLLLLDEPAAGLSHAEVEQLIGTVARGAAGVRPDRGRRRAPHGADLRAHRPGRRAGPRGQADGGDGGAGAVGPPRGRGLPGQGGGRR